MEKIKNNISEISFPLKFWRYFILFQSANQMISWVIALIFSMVIIIYLSSLDPNSKAPLSALLWGGGIGSTFSLMAVFPVRFSVRDDGLHVLGEIEVRLLKINYVEESHMGDEIIYRQNLPRFLRWDEGNLKIKKEKNIFIVSGAYVGIRKLRKSLMRE